ncbi:hypothetical protein [Pseudomonas sp. UBA2684]|uniref:hypothetical protein n=1 Tax=Pseudomonas sp. UBA2684 TaxID=1947311 RepID=UPI000E7E96F4|nr:hypothetical protein [Pseudomonas sp. UBA2684]HBX54959.1 hypothetical protein [Pseudomonas sp.]|tara:strand:+ start:4015 stop:5172 length:1158 start_codon:yes stop_codon:yes gene_type:complete
MRKSFFNTANKFEPFTALYGMGASPNQVKAAVIQLLNPYVTDKTRLHELAVSALAGEAISVARLSSQQDWKAILDTCFAIREKAIAVDDRRAFELMSYFESAITEAQKQYSLLVVFEVPKDDLALDEFSFELFRTLGVLIESSIQPYIKEIYCLQIASAGGIVDPIAVAAEDFGQVCEKLEKLLKDATFLTPDPWGVRVNQLRNIAQHHSYRVQGNSVVATYGRSQPPKRVVFTRSDLIVLAQELVSRLGALKSSRAITHLNHIEKLGSYLPETAPHRYNEATALAASFATQGFRLLDLTVTDIQATAVLEDVAPGEGYLRPVHCSQFVATIASHFPSVSVQVRYLSNGHHSWTFEASAQNLERVMQLDEPLRELAQIVTFKKEP